MDLNSGQGRNPRVLPQGLWWPSCISLLLHQDETVPTRPLRVMGIELFCVLDSKPAKFFWFWETTHRHLGMFISVETWERPCRHSAGAVVLRKLTVTHRHLAHWCAIDLRVNISFSQWEMMGWDSAWKRRQKWRTWRREARRHPKGNDWRSEEKNFSQALRGMAFGQNLLSHTDLVIKYGVDPQGEQTPQEIDG